MDRSRVAAEYPMETLIEEELSSLSFSSEDSEVGWRCPTGLLLSPEERRPLMEHERRRPPQAVGNYLLGDILGCGGYSKVKDALHTGTLARRAVKIVRRSCLRRIPFGEQTVRRETCLLGGLRHPHILRLHEVLAGLHPDKAFLVLDYCPLSLQALLDAAPANRLAAWQARAYLRQLCAAVCYLQARAIVHKDIKPANLLLAPDGRLTLADFGVAEALPLFSSDDCCTRSDGSPAYQPPEVANCEPKFSGFKLDVWSCGVTLYCMLLGVHPFLEGCTTVYQLQTRIATYQVVFPNNMEAVSEEVLRGLMARDPCERWSAERLSEHAWVSRAPPPPPLPAAAALAAPPGRGASALIAEPPLRAAGDALPPPPPPPPAPPPPPRVTTRPPPPPPPPPPHQQPAAASVKTKRRRRLGCILF